MSDNKKKIYKPRPVSGFPEWLPETRRVEQLWFDHIRRVFESYGFCNIETPSVEELDAINAKGGDGGADADKEIYVIERLHKEDGDKEARLALHFDQTVPLARYTAQHFNDLVFPFKRYQMQRVWRGERPQAGRFREFYQCDIDVINVDNLPLHFDAEMPAIIWEILSSLPGMEKEKIQIRISNRKILWGFLDMWGLQKKADYFWVIDKKDKLGKQEFKKEILRILLSEPSKHVDLELEWEFFEEFLSTKYVSSEDLLRKRDELLKDNDFAANEIVTLIGGLEELALVLDQLSHLPKDSVIADLSIVRGLDYYTGTVYETNFINDNGSLDTSYGSICSGGRYDDLASNYINKHLPGVGISIGFSRLFDRLRQQNKLPVLPISPAQFLITLEDESLRPRMMATAQTLRAQGHNVETYHSPRDVRKQLEYAVKKGIRYVWLLPNKDRSTDEVKDMDTRDQRPTKTDDWK